MHAAYVLHAGDLQPVPRIISDESGERQCINIRGKRLRDAPGLALMLTNTCSRSESASQERRRRLTIMTITASDDGRIHPRNLTLRPGEGTSSCESGERIPKATVRNLCPHLVNCDPLANLLTGPPRRGLGLIYVRQCLR